jgi:hypothetical protein
MILKILSPKKLSKKLAFLLKQLPSSAKNITITLFLKKANIFSENLQKSQKIVIITSAPLNLPQKCVGYILHKVIFGRKMRPPVRIKAVSATHDLIRPIHVPFQSNRRWYS